MSGSSRFGLYAAQRRSSAAARCPLCLGTLFMTVCCNCLLYGAATEFLGVCYLTLLSQPTGDSRTTPLDGFAAPVPVLLQPSRAWVFYIASVEQVAARYTFNRRFTARSVD
jgi:hypothetical protein